MKIRILLVEDNAANMELARYLLDAAGYEVLLASNGVEGLALAREQRPDLVLSDLQMPLMDGYALIAELKASPGCQAIPVVALTALSMPGDEGRALDAGFDGYLSKPIEPEQFAAQVACFVRAGPRAAPSGEI